MLYCLHPCMRCIQGGKTKYPGKVAIGGAAMGMTGMQSVGEVGRLNKATLRFSDNIDAKLAEVATDCLTKMVTAPTVARRPSGFVGWYAAYRIRIVLCVY